MADKLTYVSKEGLDKLQAELAFLKNTRRRELAERINAAKALGDLSENAEYHEAKDDLAFTTARIQEIENMLKNVSLIEDGVGGTTVQIGSTVTIEVGCKNKSYKIVGSNEADPVSGLISNESPLGSAFLGRSKGDRVDVETPAGTSTYTILSIS